MSRPDLVDGTGDPRPAGDPTPPLGRVTSRSDLVETALREMILAGRFRPGETLVERQLAALLGVSKTPVREALIALASTGLVTVARNRGVVVRRPGRDDMGAVFELRLLLEPWAVGRTAQRGSPRAVEVARAALDEAAELLGAQAVEDRTRLSLVNRRFHRALYDECGNDLVVTELERLQDLISLGLVRLWGCSAWPVWRDEDGEHRDILEAVAAGDAGSASRLAHEHITRAMKLFRQHWQPED